MITVTTMDMRKHVGDILNRVALRGDEYLIERKGKPLAVMMSVEKAGAIRRAAQLRLGEWLSRDNAAKSDAEVMALANEARRATRVTKRAR